MMHKRTVYSLLLISFIVVISASLSFANTVTVESKVNIPRCANQVADVTIAPSQSISAAEVVLEITAGGNGGFLTVDSVVWDAAVTAALGDVLIDMSQADGVSPDTIRFTAMSTTGGSLGAGSYTATIYYLTSDVCEDVITIDNAVFDYPNPTATITTQFADASGIIPVQFTAGSVTITNQAPTMATVADATIHWGDFFSASAAATDPDLAGGCETLVYSLVSGPAAMNINATTGAITWQTVGADVCVHTVEVLVTDACGGTDSQTFDICVQNDAPTIACPADMEICFGNTLSTSVVGTDIDGGPFALTYSLVSFDGVGTPLVNPATGAVTWATGTGPEYTGTFEICVAVTDGANVCDPCSPRAADTCCFNVTVSSMAVTIQTQNGTGLGVIQGQEQTVSIDMLGSAWNNIPIAGYDFLIQYDNSALSLLNVSAGDFLVDCGWEYFQFRYGPNGNCTGGCPSGVVRIVAIAESNDGIPFAGCYDNSANGLTQLAEMRFLVSNDRTLECQMVPIRFVWYDCGDNTLSTVSGDTLLVSRNVYDFSGANITADSPFPSNGGANSTCDVSDKGTPVLCADFFNGGIKIVCGDDIDAVGDINLNGVAYEVADAVMFTNYFISGLSAFDGHADGSIAASDANKDGIPLSVADLVYLIRVVVGDALPYTKEVASANVTYTVSDGVISVQGSTEIGAAHIVVAGEVNPDLLAGNMEMSYRYDGANTRIIVNSGYKTFSGFTGEVLGNIDGEILSIDMATSDGVPVAAKNIPTDYELLQNYPNPFNPTSTIAFSSPAAGEYSVTIFNINGQVVETISGNLSAPGRVAIEWDASNLASGVYLYKLDINDYSKVMKAVLLK